MKQLKGISFVSLILIVGIQGEIFADEDCVGTMCEKSDLAHSGDLPKPQMEEYDYKRRQKTTKESILAESLAKPEAPTTPEQKVLPQTIRKKTQVISQKKKESGIPLVGNLPVYFASMEQGEEEDTTDILSGSVKRDRVRGIRIGERIESVIHEDLTVSGNTPIPVSAEILSGPFKGGIFKGEASLEPDLKLIRISFNQLIPKDRDAVYTVGATARRSSGEYALEGEFTSSDTRFFVGQVVSGAAAGFVGATLDRPQPVAGPYYETPSLPNAGKEALIGGLSETAKMMANRATSAPQYTKIKGPLEILVEISSAPTTTED